MSLENLSVWTIRPNWESEITETLEFLTTVLASRIGAEQRFANRITPRRYFEMSFTPHGPARTLFDMFLQSVGGSYFYMPMWHDTNHLATSVVSGADILPIANMTGSEFAQCPGVIILGSILDPFDYEIAEVFNTSGSDVNLVVGITRDWSKGSRIFPLQKFSIESLPTASRKADRAFEATIKFRVEAANTTAATVMLNEYGGYSVLEREPNDVSDLTFAYSRLMAELDNNTSLRSRIDLNPWSVTVQQFAFYMKRRADHDWVRGLFYQLRGRQYPIYVPTFEADFDVVSDITDEIVIVKRCGYTDYAGPFRGRENIVFHLIDGTRIYRKIISSSIVDPGTTERLVLDSGATILKNAIHRVSFLSLSRLDQDALEIVHHSDTAGLATCTTVFKTLPQDREAREPVPRYIYFQVEITNTASDTFGGGGYTCCVGLAGTGGNLLSPLQLDVVFGNNPELDQMFFWTALRVHDGQGGGWKAAPGRAKVVNLPDQMVMGFAIDRVDQRIWTHNPTFEPDNWRSSNADYVDPPNPVTGVNGYPFGSNPNADPDTAPDGGPGGTAITGNVYLLLGAGHDDGKPYPSMKLVLDPSLMHGTGLPDGFSPATVFLKMNPGDSSPYLSISTDGLTVTSLDIPGGNQSTAFCRSIGSISNAI